MINFFNYSNEMFCLADHRGYFTEVNQAWTKTLGWSSAELVSRPYFDYVHPDDLAATQREAGLLLSGTHETVLFENRYRCRDGSYRWLAWRAVLAPETRQLVATARDVTEQKLQAEALRESEERFRLLATRAPIGITRSDPSGSIYFANSRWCEMAGVTPEEALGYSWKEFIHPDDLPRVINHWQSYLHAEQDMPAQEFRFLHRNGDVRWVSASAASLRDADGKLCGQISSVQDVTERKLAEEALRESEERFRAFMNHSPALAWVKDEQGRYVYMNKVFEDFADIRPGEWLGKTDFDLWAEDDARKIREFDLAVLASDGPRQITERSVFAKHPDLYLLKTKFVFQDGCDRRYVGGVAFDVTELKRSEQSLRDEQNLLRNLIEVQEREKQFLCHEFHDGLIQYAVGSLMMLEGFRNQHPFTEATATVDKVIGTVIGNLRRGIDDGRRVIRGIRPAVLDDFGLEAAIDDLVGQYETSGIHVTGKCDPDIGRLPESIQTTVYRVVQEALSNAKKYSGTDVVRIELKKLDGNLHLEIRDFGCGFDVEPARRRGFGLLGMTERVRLLGGECRIQSERDAGTCISVRLPIPPADEAT